MEYAQKLLKESEDEVGTVAWKCGYPDGSYFYTGVSEDVRVYTIAVPANGAVNL